MAPRPRAPARSRSRLTHSLTKGSEYPLASMAARCTQRTMPTMSPPCWVLYMRDTRIFPRSSTSPPRSTCGREGVEEPSRENSAAEREGWRGYQGMSDVRDGGEDNGVCTRDWGRDMDGVGMLQGLTSSSYRAIPRDAPVVPVRFVWDGKGIKGLP